MRMNKDKIMAIPTKQENPSGLHQKYIIHKEDGSPIALNSEYFVLRLDSGGDPDHVAACRKAVLVYADEIAPYIPGLVHDIRMRYG